MSTEDNEVILKKLEADANIADAEEAAKRARAVAFDPKALIGESNDILEIQDEVLGTVKFGKLTLKEFKTVNSLAKDNEEKSYRMLYAMLHKAYPALTYAEMEDMPFDKIARLSNLLSKEVTRFLPKTT
jgi:hypothetical protein